MLKLTIAFRNLQKFTNLQKDGEDSNTSYRHSSWYYLYCVSFLKGYIRSPFGSNKFSGFGKSRFQMPSWKSIILNHTAAIHGYTSYYVTTTAFLTLPVYYKLQNAQWSEQYSVHKINRDIHFVCELHVTVKVYRAECSLSEAACSCILSPLRLNNNKLMEKWNRNFKGIWKISSIK